MRSRASRASGWSAARCATSCSAARRASSTSSSRATPWPWRGARRSASAATSSSTSASGPRPSRADGRRVRPRGGRRETYAHPGALPDVELGATHGGGPRPPRLHGQRDRRRASPTGAGRSGPARATTSRPACCGSCTSARSSTTRRACCGSPATPRGSGSTPEPHTAALIDPRLHRHRHRRPARQRDAAARRRAAPALTCSSAPASARSCSAAVSNPSTTASAAARARRLPHERPARGAHAAPRPPRFPRQRTPHHRRRRDGFERLHTHLDVPDAELWRLLRRERPETAELLAAAGNDGAQRWLDDVRHRKLEITGADLIAAGPDRRGDRRGAGGGNGRDARREGQDRAAQIDARSAVVELALTTTINAHTLPLAIERRRDRRAQTCAWESVLFGLTRRRRTGGGLRHGLRAAEPCGAAEVPLVVAERAGGQRGDRPRGRPDGGRRLRRGRDRRRAPQLEPGPRPRRATAGARRRGSTRCRPRSSARRRAG